MRYCMLHNHVMTRFELAPRPKQLAPFLDIDEILAHKKWEKSKLNTEDIRSVTDTITFMKLVLIGQQIADKTAKNRVISANSTAINAFNIANKGYHQLTFRNQINLQRLTETSILVLLNILSYASGKEEISFNPEELDMTHEFFKSIANMVLSQTYIP